MHPNVKITQTNFYIGAPDPKDKEKIAEFKERGGNFIWVVTNEEEKKTFACPYGDLAVEWKNDGEIRAFLFEHIAKQKQDTLGQVWGAKSDRFNKFVEILLNVTELHTFDAHSNKILGKDNTPTKNGWRNFRWIDDGVPLSRLKDMAKPHKAHAIIVAAGPSLDSQWGDLKRVHPNPNSGCVIGVGRSYSMMMRSGICPEFVVEAEQYDWNAAIWNFAPIPLPHTVLCCPLPVTPKILNGWPGGKCILVDHATAQMMGMKAGEDSIDGGNSVAHLAFNLAVHLGCNPIYLAGVDLGYPDGEKGDTHAKGTFHDGWGKGVIASEHSFQGDLMVPANDGTAIRSSQPYINFKTFFELAIYKAKQDNPNLKVYTFSKRGQKIEGVEYLELSTWDGTSPSPSSSPSSLPLESAASVSSVAVPFPSGSPESTSETPPKP